MADTDRQLNALLGADPPPSVTALPADARADLVDLVHTARSEQAAALQAAFDATLRHVPFPVRAIVKRIVS